MDTLSYDAVRMVDDPAYADEVWGAFREWISLFEKDLIVKPEVLDSFGNVGRMQLIFATTALQPGILVDAGNATEWIRQTMRDAFNGRGRLGGNYREVLAHIVVTLRTGTYTQGVVSGEEQA